MRARVAGAGETVVAWGVRAASLLVLIGGWDVLATRSPTVLFPRPLEVARALASMITTPSLRDALWTSNQAMALGFALAVAVGVPAGIAFGVSPRIARAADVFLDVLLVTPMPALAPLLVLAAGLGLLTRVLVVWTFALPVIVVATTAGVRQADPATLEMARAFGATRPQLWRTVLLPGALPTIAEGLRLGLGRALSGMVAVELLVVAVGIGRLLLRFQGDFEAASAFALALLVAAEGVLLTAIVSRLERAWIRWPREARA